MSAACHRGRRRSRRLLTQRSARETGRSIASPERTRACINCPHAERARSRRTPASPRPQDCPRTCGSCVIARRAAAAACTALLGSASIWSECRASQAEVGSSATRGWGVHPYLSGSDRLRLSIDGLPLPRSVRLSRSNGVSRRSGATGTLPRRCLGNTLSRTVSAGRMRRRWKIGWVFSPWNQASPPRARQEPGQDASLRRVRPASRCRPLVSSRPKASITGHALASIQATRRDLNTV